MSDAVRTTEFWGWMRMTAPEAVVNDLGKRNPRRLKEKHFSKVVALIRGGLDYELRTSSGGSPLGRMLDQIELEAQRVFLFTEMLDHGADFFCLQAKERKVIYRDPVLWGTIKEYMARKEALGDGLSKRGSNLYHDLVATDIWTAFKFLNKPEEAGTKRLNHEPWQRRLGDEDYQGNTAIHMLWETDTFENAKAHLMGLGQGAKLTQINMCRCRLTGYLMDIGLDPLAENKDQQTPLDLMRHCGVFGGGLKNAPLVRKIEARLEHSLLERGTPAASSKGQPRARLRSAPHEPQRGAVDMVLWYLDRHECDHALPGTSNPHDQGRKLPWRFASARL